jgi:hypothetical protein
MKIQTKFYSWILCLFFILTPVYQTVYAQEAATVEEAQKNIAKRRKKEAKAAKKAKKQSQKAYWDRQSKEAKKSVKKNAKRQKKAARKRKK